MRGYVASWTCEAWEFIVYLRKCYLDIWMAPECEAGVRSNGWSMSG